MNRKPMLSFHVNIGKFDDFNNAILDFALSNTSDYVCVANAHMVVEARKSMNFAAIINNALIVTPDGKPLTWALNFLHGVQQERVAGMDLLPQLLASAESRNVPVFFYGGSPLLLSKTENFINKKYPSLNVAGYYSPPFRDLSRDEEEEVADRINQSGARLVFVVLGCPKQEKWMHRMKGKINSLMIGIGGALPVLIGVQKRAPVWMQETGLEWLYRLGQEPYRLFRRYAVTNAIFIAMLLKACFRKVVLNKEVKLKYDLS